jgi:hypothetical protein
MDLVSAVALVLLTLVGYSAGAAACAGRGKQPVPRLPDLPLAAMVIVAALVLRPDLGRWLSIAAGVAAGFGLGWLALIPRRQRLPQTPVRESSGGSVVGRGWHRWKVFAGRMGNFQGRMVLSLFYMTFVAPFALLARFVSNPLGRKRPPGWHRRGPEDRDRNVDQARNQF